MQSPGFILLASKSTFSSKFPVLQPGGTANPSDSSKLRAGLVCGRVKRPWGVVFPLSRGNLCLKLSGSGNPGGFGAAGGCVPPPWGSGARSGAGPRHLASWCLVHPWLGASGDGRAALRVPAASF